MKWKLTGELTLHGVTKVVTLPIQLEVRGDVATAVGKMTVKQTDFGMKPYSALFGALMPVLWKDGRPLHEQLRSSGCAIGGAAEIRRCWYHP